MARKYNDAVEFEGDWEQHIPSALLEYTAEELEGWETLSQGQADDLKVAEFIDGFSWRVWLCRCGVEDGMPYDDMVTVEVLDPRDHKWKDAARYPG